MPRFKNSRSALGLIGVPPAARPTMLSSAKGMMRMRSWTVHIFSRNAHLAHMKRKFEQPS